MFIANYVAMDITNTEIRVLAMKGRKFEKWATAPLSEGVVKSGIVREPKAMGVVIDNLFKSLKLRRNHVIVTMTGLPFIYRTVTMPGGRRIPTEAIERESRREMSLGEQDMYLTWQVTETQQTKQEANYFVLGVPRTSLNPLVESLACAGIKQYSIDVKPLALARMAGLKDAIVVSFETDNIDIVLVAEGLVRVIHSFSPGEKSGDTFGSVNEIANGLNRAIKSFERDFPDHSIPIGIPIFISGKSLPNDSFLTLVQAACGREVKVISSTMNFPTGIPLGIYATVLGLIVKKMPKSQTQSYRDIDLDLLKGIKRLHAHKFQTAWVLAAVLSLALAVLVIESHGLKTKAAVEVVALQQQAAILNQKLSEAQKLNQQTLLSRQTAAQKAKEADQKLLTIKKTIALIDSRRIDFGSQIASITNSVPGGVELVTLDFQPNKIEIKGNANDGFDVLKLAEELETCTYFSSVRVEQLLPAETNKVGFQLSISSKPEYSLINTRTVK